MKTRLSLLTILFSLICYSQVPFTTLSMEPINVNIDDPVKNTFSFSQSVAIVAPKTTTKKSLDFFSNSSLSTSLLNTGNRVSISSEVLHYKLFIANPDAAKIAAGTRKYRFNIPLMFISRLSTQYDSITSASSWDALDYEAAPITIRVMPSFKLDFKGFNDVIYLGFYTDARGLNFHNSETNDYKLEFVGSAGIGFTYQGDGEAGKYNENGEYKPGKYSLSFIFQGATGKKDVLQKLFITEKEYITSLQAYFLFKVSEDSSFNIKMGYQYLFQETQAGAKSNFTIALGI